MRLKLLKLTAVFSFLSLFQGCGVQPSQKTTSSSLSVATAQNWDVNDISVLYPLRKRFANDDSGKMVRLNEGKGLISASQFAAVLKVFKQDFKLDFSTGSLSPTMNTLDKWVVTGFRIDPCFKRKSSDACVPQVRVVAQAISPDETTTTDFALHFFYEPKESTLTLLNSLVSLRETYARPEDRLATIGKPLGVHPILGKKGGMASPYAKALKEEFLLKYLSPENMTDIAVAFIEPSQLQPWIFFRDDAKSFSKAQDNSIFVFDPSGGPNDCGVENGRLICRKELTTGNIIDSAEKTSGNQSESALRGRTKEGKPYLDDFLTLVQRETNGAYPSVTKNLSYWEGIFSEIENPKLVLPGDTNCTSCHRTQTDRNRFRGVFTLDPKGGANAFQAEPGSGCTPGVGIDYSRTGIKTFNVRVFGYLHDMPIVSQRVANESVKVCEDLKRQLR